MATVTGIEKVRHRFRVMTDDGEVFWIPYSLFQERPLQSGAVMDVDEYDAFLFSRLYKPALQLSVTWLAQRAMSAKEISDKLLRIGYRQNIASVVLERLEKEGFLNDAEFARSWVTSRAGKLGSYRLTMELKKKGIEEDQIRNALEEIDPEDQLQGAIRLAIKSLSRAKPDEDPRKANQRAAAMLARHGYSWDVSRQAISAARKQTEE